MSIKLYVNADLECWRCGRTETIALRLKPTIDVAPEMSLLEGCSDVPGWYIGREDASCEDSVGCKEREKLRWKR